MSPVNQKVFPITSIKLKNSETIKFDYDKVENAAVLSFTRMERFVEGYGYQRELIKLYNRHLGIPDIHENGLVHHLETLRDEVISSKKIGLVLAGLNVKETLINNYYDPDGVHIELTVSSISIHLLQHFFPKEIVDQLCRGSPNFSIYYY